MNRTGTNKIMKPGVFLAAFLLFGVLPGYAESITNSVLSDTFEGRPVGALATDGGWTAVNPTSLNTKRRLEVMADSGDLLGDGTGNQILFFQNIADNPGTYITTLTADGLSSSAVLMVRFDFHETAATTGGITIKVGGDPNATDPVNEFTLTDGAVGPSGSYSVGAAHHLDAVFNESGATLNYDDPAGGSSSLATGLMDIWIDNIRVVAGVTQGRSGSPSTQLSSVFLTSDGSNQEIYLDNIEVLDNGIYVQPPPTISSFTADPPEVVPGGSTTLSWSTTDADSLSIDQGIGDVTGMSSIPVVVTDHTTYSLIAINAAGSATSTVSVALILPDLAITNLVVGTGTVEMEWNQPSDHYIVMSGDDLFSFPAAGTVEVSETNTANSAAVFPYAADQGFFRVMFGVATVDSITSPALHEELKVQSPINAPTNEVYDVDFAGVSGMTLPGQEITMAELGEFDHLDKLSLAGSSLTTLGDLSVLDGITWLNLSSNQLTSVSALSSVTSLEALDLQDNLITDLTGIESLVRLRWLDLENNQITDLSAVVANAAAGGLGEDDELWVRGNPLSATVTNQIQTLETTYNVKVIY